MAVKYQRLAIFAILLATVFTISTNAEKINNLPGYQPGPNKPELSMDSGYVTVDQHNGRNLFYWLIRAEKEHHNKPLIVWFQGGPGCSGLGGLFSENGPLRVGSDGETIDYTNQGWTQFANMLFIEQPAFVGFSYSDEQSDRNTNDDRAAADNYAFMKGFIKQFPEFEGRDIWFSGESYGGVYVPMASYLILSGPDQKLKEQFKGFMIGNPVFSCQGGFIGDGPAYNYENFNLLYWHGLVSYTNFANWTKYGCNVPKDAGSKECEYILNVAIDQVGVIDQQLQKRSAAKNFPSLDPDDLYQEFCIDNGTLEFSLSSNVDWEKKCFGTGARVQHYLNQISTQKAIHAKHTLWSECTGNINYTISGRDMLQYYDQFWKLKPDFKVLVYSGDIDILTVPFAYTAPCMVKLADQLKVENSLEWQPWFVNGATAGYFEQFEKFTYATVKGAGHETPQYQPTTAFEMVKRFMHTSTLLDENHFPTQMNRAPTRQGDIIRLLRSKGYAL
eukprot:TRINITY_DN6785_c0_g1_i1.p1 TRINITY_DN6785_c0_g1~~TRINITY_DN6785_c0_g1_i1.p1  ORF type:complete len:502 (-),score=123.02 TRINITY_DN6785_c0_g1_i1:21-1526(-)